MTDYLKLKIWADTGPVLLRQGEPCTRQYIAKIQIVLKKYHCKVPFFDNLCMTAILDKVRQNFAHQCQAKKHHNAPK